MELKSKLIGYLSQQLGIKKTYVSPHHLQANGKFESPHRFIKDCICKLSVDGVLEWDQLLHCATAAFNWFLNKHFQESPHFLYFRTDPYLPHQTAFLQPKLRYLGSDKGMICLEKLRQADMLAALKTKEAYSKQSKQKYADVPNYKIGDLFMIKSFDKKSNWDVKYIPSFRIVHLIGSRQLEVSNPMGKLIKVNVCDVHKILPSDQIASSIPDEQVFGRRSKYINDPCILKEVAIIGVFLDEKFPCVRIKHK